MLVELMGKKRSTYLTVEIPEPERIATDQSQHELDQTLSSRAEKTLWQFVKRSIDLLARRAFFKLAIRVRPVRRAPKLSPRRVV